MQNKDYTSRVPQFHFASTLEEQLKQLEENPLLHRLVESRRKQAADRYRPSYHFVSPESTLNDPNGLCFWNGKWHLFYQGYPPEDPRQHWGHAVSDNLIHWKDLPYAIYPHPEKCVFSGSTLVEDDRVIAMYHGTEVGNMVAVSSDPLLLNWEKLTDGAVIPKPKDWERIGQSARPYPSGDQDDYWIFDPCIWKKDGMYYSLSGETLPDKYSGSGKRVRTDFLFRSPDLRTWEYMHPFDEGDRFTLLGDDGACPYFWPIGDRHILLFFSHMSGGQALLGDYDQQRDKFVVSSHHRFNFGSVRPGGVHAPSATPDGQGNVIAIFNINEGKKTGEWNQIMSLPMKLSLLGRDELGMEPAGDIAALRHDHRKVEELELPANREIVLEPIRGNAMELYAEIDTKDAPMVELNVLRSPNKEEYTRIAFYRERGYKLYGDTVADSLISIDSSYSSTLEDAVPRAPETASVALGKGETLKLRIFIDKSVVEVFVNGKRYAALRVYPGREDSVGVSLRSQGKSAVLKSLDAWQMKDIYSAE
ncbi:glycoside hydrolase family 32 protein [Paenibacillus piri]|uniref:beta-fructofuranosidase n=1 Tax=Paenibacillus piri TaxID=2547395 RepID=A0A4R5KUZ1_9BACL|nr:glycoside hydrolase family 32 protein [Paenibacillus piri]TDF98777.1 glycosyl hydrolase family 32 domain protein [Paenibacillus piri]